MILLELSFIMDKRKKGIALLITLVIVASIMSIIAVSFAYLGTVQKDAGTTSATIQGDLLYNNTVQILKQHFPSGKDNSDKLDIIYNMPLMLSESKSGFSLNLRCNPLMIGTPISWLDQGLTTTVPKKSELARDVLSRVLEEYEIEDPSQFEEVILQAITGRTLGNADYVPRLKPQKGIISKQQFSRIVTNYRLLYDDPKVLEVPWEKYFSFTTINKKTKIDGKYLSAEFISVAFEIPIEIVQDSWDPQTDSLSTFLSNNGISTIVNKKIYSTKALNAMHCEQTYAYKKRQYGFNFDYIEGRSGNFEFNGQEQ